MLCPRVVNCGLWTPYPHCIGIYISICQKLKKGLFYHSIHFRQVIIVLTQLEGSGGFSIAHRLTHRLSGGRLGGLGDWAPSGATAASEHAPPLDRRLEGLHVPRPL